MRFGPNFEPSWSAFDALTHVVTRSRPLTKERSPSGGGAFASHVAGAGGGEARQLGEGEAPRAPAHLPPLSALELVAGSPLRLPGGEVGLVVAVDAPAEGVAVPV